MVLLHLCEAPAKAGTPQSVGRWLSRFTIEFRKSRRWWINEMEDCCSHKSYNTRTRWHGVKLAEESFKTGKGKTFGSLLTQGAVKASSKGYDKGMCIKGI